MRAFFLRVIVFLILVVAAYPAYADDPFRMASPQALLIDGDTGAVLFSKQADTPFPPASLAKLMTAEIVFNGLASGRIHLNDEYFVSEYAWRTGGAPSRTTTMFASLNSHISIDNLLQGLMVPQGNDAAIILAEGIAGSEQAFAERMTTRAKELGMNQTRFVNATGLPADGQQTTLRDMLILARHVEEVYPQYYARYAQPSFEWNRIFQRNRNPLISLGIGADGLVNGFVEKKGYSIIASAQRDGRRLFLGLSGASKEKERNEDAKRLIEWGMTAFETKLIYDAGEQVGRAKVFGGVESSVPLIAVNAVGVLLPKQNMPQIRARIIYHGPLVAPVEASQVVGHLQILAKDNVLVTQPVMTAGYVNESSFSKKARDGLFEVCLGWLRKYGVFNL